MDGSYHLPVKAGTYYVQPNGGDLIERNIAPTTPKEAAISAPGTIEVNFNLVSPTGTINVHVMDTGVMNLSDIGVFILDKMPFTTPLAYLMTDSSGIVTFKVVAGAYYVGVSYDDAFNAGYLINDMPTVSVEDGQTKNVDFHLRPFTAETAVDAILKIFNADSTEHSFLNVNKDDRLDIADVITLILQGK